MFYNSIKKYVLFLFDIFFYDRGLLFFFFVEEVILEIDKVVNYLGVIV